MVAIVTTDVLDACQKVVQELKWAQGQVKPYYWVPSLPDPPSPQLWVCIAGPVVPGVARRWRLPLTHPEAQSHTLVSMASLNPLAGFKQRQGWYNSL